MIERSKASGTGGNVDLAGAEDDIVIRPSGLNDKEATVFRRLLDAIAERRLAPGVKLVEEELAEAFSVSRERVRRILLVLSQHGIVRLEPNKGASVARPDARERRDAFEARRLIERYVVTRLTLLGAARRRMVVKQLQRHIDTETKALAAGERGLQIRLSGEFHLLMAYYSDNMQLLRMLQEVIARMSLALAAHAHHQDLDCSIAEHATLLGAIAAGDASRAESLLVDHLGHLEEDMADSISRSSELQRALFD